MDLAAEHVWVGHRPECGWVWELRRGEEILEESERFYHSRQETLEAAQRSCGTLLPTADARLFDLLEALP